jgi:hypothetical protein
MSISRGSKGTRGESQLGRIARKVVLEAGRIFVIRGKDRHFQPSRVVLGDSSTLKEQEKEEPVANIYLKGGETVQIPLSQADAYMAANRDKLEYRTHKPRRKRN